MHLAPGTIIGGRHRIESLLGQGGFGAVYCATQLALDRAVALKVLLPEALGDEGVQRFQREAAIVQQLEHPNIVRLLDFGVGAGGEPYLVFELLHGQTLEEVIRKGGPLSPARAARVGVQVLKALMEAHGRGIVHRDIKPANIFLCNFHGEPDFVKVLDFGIAKGADSRTLTGRGGVVGTPAYMAPEQVDGGEVTFAADLFALGLTLEEALTGKAVYGGLSLVDIVREHLSSPAVPHAPEVLSSSLGPVIERATMKRPEMRYRSAAEMLAHLEAALNAAPTAAPVAPRVLVPAPPPAPPRKRSAPPWALFAALGGGVVLLGGALAAVTALSGERAKDSPRAATSAAPVATESQSPDFFLHDAASVAEVDANGDAVPDLIGTCLDRFSDPMSLCAVDGSTFRVLWRKPLGVDFGGWQHHQLGGSGRGAVLVDPLGVAHIYDARSGDELSAIRLGARVDRICAPPELPGRVWVKTTDARGVMIDTAARTSSDAPRPASCPRQRGEFHCSAARDPRVCPSIPVIVTAREILVREHLTEGAHGVAFGTKKGDLSIRMLAGFDGRAKSTDPNVQTLSIRWQRPIGGNGGLDAVDTSHDGDLELRGGRVVTAYKDIRGNRHIFALDASDGRPLWDVVAPDFSRLSLSATRLYVDRRSRLDVYDAATGRKLGGIGPER